jgi:hypothetical protein
MDLLARLGFCWKTVGISTLVSRPACYACARLGIDMDPTSWRGVTNWDLGCNEHVAPMSSASFCTCRHEASVRTAT